MKIVLSGEICGLSGAESITEMQDFCIRIPVPASQCAKTKLALYSLIVFSIRHTAEVDKCFVTKHVKHFSTFISSRDFTGIPYGTLS